MQTSNLPIARHDIRQPGFRQAFEDMNAPFLELQLTPRVPSNLVSRSRTRPGGGANRTETYEPARLRIMSRQSFGLAIKKPGVTVIQPERALT